MQRDGAIAFTRLPRPQVVEQYLERQLARAYLTSSLATRRVVVVVWQRVELLLFGNA
jgi:hypothetical protein